MDLLGDLATHRFALRAIAALVMACAAPFVAAQTTCANLVGLTIPAGAIGNQLPIEVVTERWDPPALQMAVRITRRDPRSGETVYRLTNLSRTEPPADLFAPPSDFEVQDAARKFQIEAFIDETRKIQKKQ